MDEEMATCHISDHIDLIHLGSSYEHFERMELYKEQPRNIMSSTAQKGNSY